MCVAEPAICTFDRMTGIVYVLLRYHGGGTDTEIRLRTEVNPGEEKTKQTNKQNKTKSGEEILPPILPGLEPEMFWSRVRGFTSEPFSLPGILPCKVTKAATARQATSMAASFNQIQSAESSHLTVPLGTGPWH